MAGAVALHLDFHHVVVVVVVDACAVMLMRVRLSNESKSATPIIPSSPTSKNHDSLDLAVAGFRSACARQRFRYLFNLAICREGIPPTRPDLG